MAIYVPIVMCDLRLLYKRCLLYYCLHGGPSILSLRAIPAITTYTESTPNPIREFLLTLIRKSVVITML